MQSRSRRSFILSAGVAAGGIGLGVFPKLSDIISSSRTKTDLATVALRPVEGYDYSESLLRIMKEARFDSAEKAAHAISNPTVPFQIVLVSS